MMDTYDQIKELMIRGTGKPPVKASIAGIVGAVSTITTDILDICKKVQSEKEMTEDQTTQVEGDVMSMILVCEEWMRHRYNKEFGGHKLTKENMDRLSTEMIFKNLLHKATKGEN